MRETGSPPASINSTSSSTAIISTLHTKHSINMLQHLFGQLVQHQGVDVLSELHFRKMFQTYICPGWADSGENTCFTVLNIPILFAIVATEPHRVRR